MIYLLQQKFNGKWGIMLRKTTLEKSIAKEKKRSANAIMGKKITNSIKEVNKQSKKGGMVKLKEPLRTYHQEIYEDMFSFVTTPISDDYLKKCAREWIDVTKNNEEVLLTYEYRVQKEIPETTWSRWIKRSPELQFAQDLVRDIIAIRREKGGLLNKYNTVMVTKVQSHYSDAWKSTEEWRSSLSAKNESSNIQPIQVVLEAYPNSPLVPAKKMVESE